MVRLGWFAADVPLRLSARVRACMLEDDACIGSGQNGPKQRWRPTHNSRMTFELQPVLRGQLLWLRPLRADDWDQLYAVASDPLIWEQHPAPDRYKEDVFRDFFREAMESGGAFVILDARNDRVIGSSRYLGYDPARSEIEIGFTFLARPYLGWSLQPGAEGSHVEARLSVCPARCFSGWTRELAVAEGDGKNWWAKGGDAR